jgi:hypothetical protein
LLLEPIVLALAIAPSVAGFLVAAGAFAAFLARHPIRLALFDVRRGVRYPRTRAAIVFAGLYLIIAIPALVAGYAFASSALWPIAVAAAPFVIFYLAYDLRFRGRDILPELAGAVGLSAVAPAIALAAGWRLTIALGLWLLVAGRAVTSVVEVRTRLRRARGGDAPSAPSLGAHAASASAAVLSAARGIVPWAAAMVPALLLLRAFQNLVTRSSARKIAPREVGWGEMRIGVAAVIVWITAYTWGWPR